MRIKKRSREIRRTDGGRERKKRREEEEDTLDRVSAGDEAGPEPVSVVMSLSLSLF